jgi:predicted dehydrogenase
MNVLLIGLGSIGKRHVAALQTLYPSSRIFAMRSQADAAPYPGVHNIQSFAELPSEGVDFAIVANPTALHKETIESLLPLHCALFVEKPLHDTLQVEGLLAKVAAARVVNYLACNLRFLDCLNHLKSQLPSLEGKRLNEVNVYCGSYLPEWRVGQDFRKSYSANAELGGGVHIDLIHELDYLYWLFGMPTQVTRLARNRSSLEISAVDYANYILEYPPFAASVVLNYYRRDPKRTLELVWEDETWLVDLRANAITCNGQTLYASSQTVADTYLLQMQYFTSLIAAGQPSFNSLEDAFHVLQICLTT